ncbi:dihydroxyacetone kinase subunit DhaL [Streptococcus ruminantium]|uniref:Dihydroxyacetone kinase subunit DhaL n=1 Tax=Streptococcus ruminantium TaxID=1917441 RepID=A0ABU1B488_9STRE|nr:dihydroxyacetone kinase subunit DhaL [Streptococcus ruminantium]MDQ8758680.1 dihydroxyacetone kinase subunit DhaL [Streptococcus ruminantium]MDQ8765170.1 dihydroxyacetone kinase subunit DhaL [Streptococcus ruminantium]MDQ8767096.1 dihydroxyacetone kinase subunit DhaL [Streptococcus ruminantium]MDQ8769243.1 dihydroxyacetone kinase subunit DhaL [Streptococcus ruminantium]MDQ8774043.1 dihydroxyacetone kinase subunit DhaL [Streptococcus ruminantium]
METKTALLWMEKFNEKIQANKDYLSELDSPIGDGDHGGNMARGMAAVMQELSVKEYETAAQVFKVVAMQLLSKVGGASGPLYGSAFMGITKACQTGASLADTLQAGLEMIQKRGKAELGEKTMVDIWIPVISALQAENLSLNVIQEAVEGTRNIIATKGRASYVGERSIGHIDPGSFSSGLLFEAMLEVVL